MNDVTFAPIAMIRATPKQALAGRLGWKMFRLVAAVERFGVAADKAGRAAAEAGVAMRGFTAAFWSAETRRRAWFWRGFTGDDRQVATWILPRSIWWWQLGRRSGEIIAGGPQ